MENWGQQQKARLKGDVVVVGGGPCWLALRRVVGLRYERSSCPLMTVLPEKAVSHTAM